MNWYQPSEGLEVYRCFMFLAKQFKHVQTCLKLFLLFTHHFRCSFWLSWDFLSKLRSTGWWSLRPGFLKIVLVCSAMSLYFKIKTSQHRLISFLQYIHICVVLNISQPCHCCFECPWRIKELIQRLVAGSCGGRVPVVIALDKGTALRRPEFPSCKCAYEVWFWFCQGSKCATHRGLSSLVSLLGHIYATCGNASLESVNLGSCKMVGEQFSWKWIDFRLHQLEAKSQQLGSAMRLIAVNWKMANCFGEVMCMMWTPCGILIPKKDQKGSLTKGLVDLPAFGRSMVNFA